MHILSHFVNRLLYSEQVQVALLRLVSAEAILVGHSLDSDLRALRLYHRRCVDTAISYPHPRGYPLRLKLRKLAEDYLQQRIQNSNKDGRHFALSLSATRKVPQMFFV
jgi:RNA exonuclease 1